MAKYGCSIVGLTLSTTNDARTLVTAATGQGSALALSEISLSGEASSNNFARVVVNRPSAIGTGAITNVVPEKFHPASPASVFQAASTFATLQPTLSTNDVVVPAFNAFGGIYAWVAAPGFEVIVGTQGAIANLSIRSRNGTPAVSGHLIVEEF